MLSSPPGPLTEEQRQEAIHLLKVARRLAAHESSRSALAYLQHVVIDSRPEPRLFREVAEPWQWTLLSRVIPALEWKAGLRKSYTGPRGFWFTMPRGHDKTSSIGRLINWLLAFSQQPVRCVAGAADKEQAGLVLEFMQTEAQLNPWLAERLKFSNWRADGQNGARLKILAAEEKSSFGGKEDVHLLDELTHWSKRGLWDAVISGMEKRDGITIVITNAGILRSWQDDILQEIKKLSNWSVYEAPGKLASWMSDARLADLRRMVPRSLAKRLYDNKWIDAAEDCGFVTREEAERCIDPGLLYRTTGSSKFAPYYAAIDYGPVRDRTALCVLHREENNTVVVDRLDVIQGSAERRVPISLIEQWIEQTRRGFPRCTFVIDPYNLEGTIQKYEGLVEVERFEPRGGKSNYELAANLRNLIINKKIQWYEGAGTLILENGKREDLTDELVDTVIKPMIYGYRLTNELPNSHDDRVVAIGMAALQAVTTQGLIQLRLSDRYF